MQVNKMYKTCTLSLTALSHQYLAYLQCFIFYVLNSQQKCYAIADKLTGDAS